MVLLPLLLLLLKFLSPSSPVGSRVYCDDHEKAGGMSWGRFNQTCLMNALVLRIVSSFFILFRNSGSVSEPGPDRIQNMQ